MNEEPLFPSPTKLVAPPKTGLEREQVGKLTETRIAALLRAVAKTAGAA